MTLLRPRTRPRASLGFARPTDARGIVPLILGALAVGRGIYGAIDANQRKQRNKGAIMDAYRSALQRQQVHEGDVRQGTAESLNARGLLTPGAVNPGASRIASAMGAQSGYLTPSSTLGGRQQSETNRELALERHDLDAARARALNENKADALNAQINSLTGGAVGAMNAYGLSKLGAPSAPTPMPAPSGPSPDQLAAVDAIANQPVPGVQYTPSRIGTAMGVDSPDAWFGGIHGIRPLDKPGSSWNRKETLTGPGAANYDFHL